jgi:hypothetical protein
VCYFLLQLFNRPVEAGLKTLFITISEGQEKCCVSGAYIGGLINLGEEVYYYKNCKNNCLKIIVKQLGLLIKPCGKNSWFHIRVELKLARISKLQLVPFVCLNFSCPLSAAHSIFL